MPNNEVLEATSQSQQTLPEYSKLIYNLDSEGEGIKITNKNDHRFFSVRIDSETIVINSEGDLSLPIDNQTIFLDSEGFLKAAGLKVSEGEAIELAMENVDGVDKATINVK